MTSAHTRRPRPLNVLLLAASLAACEAPAPPSADLALTHVTVVDVRDGTLRPDQTVLVAGSRIVWIGPSSDTAVPSEAHVVDATGRFAVPGLWDTHVHSAAGAGWHFPLLVAYGITTVRNMHATVDDALGLTRSLSTEVATHARIGPRMLTNGPIIDGAPGSWPGAVNVSDTAQARAAVDSLHAAGADFIKVYDNLTREAYAAILDEARRLGIPVDGHMPFQVPPEAGAAAGQRTVEHLSGMTVGCSSVADSLRAEHLALIQGPPLPYPRGMFAFFALVGEADATRDPERCRAVAEAYGRAGAAAVPTLIMGVAGPDGLLGDTARMRGVPSWVRESWRGLAAQGFQPIFNGEGLEHARANTRALHDAGVPILAGTDVGNPFLVPGRSLHEELAALVDAGLPTLAALQTATLRPAETFGLADSLGVLAAGYLADLVLVAGNPLDDIRNTLTVVGVVADGRWFDAAALDELVSTAAAARPPSER
jgi:imidazolonepropionase-like amidohydrolase